VILRYGLAVVLVAVTGSGAIAASVGRLGGAGARGALLGAAFACLGAIGGMALLVRSFERGPRQFFGAVVLGILGRMTLFGAVLIYVGLRRPADYSLTAVGLSIVGFFFVFQALEVRFVLKGSKGRTS
jgi:hypothetical protein